MHTCDCISKINNSTNLSRLWKLVSYTAKLLEWLSYFGPYKLAFSKTILKDTKGTILSRFWFLDQIILFWLVESRILVWYELFSASFFFRDIVPHLLDLLELSLASVESSERFTAFSSQMELLPFTHKANIGMMLSAQTHVLPLVLKNVLVYIRVYIVYISLYC